MDIFDCVFSMCMERKAFESQRLRTVLQQGVEGLCRQTEYRYGGVKYILRFSVERLFLQPNNPEEYNLWTKSGQCFDSVTLEVWGQFNRKYKAVSYLFALLILTLKKTYQAVGNYRTQGH